MKLRPGLTAAVPGPASQQMARDRVSLTLRLRVHLESIEVGHSDIFLEYSIYMTIRSICLEYSDIYLEYINPFPIPGICLEYA
jgi:hypothetical protein